MNDARAPDSQVTQPILIRGVNWLGDAVMSTPALLRLRQAHPDAAIALLTPEKLADLWHGHPAISTVLTLTEKEGPWSVSRRLRQHQFHTGLLLPNSFRAAWELWQAGVPERIGYAGQLRSLLLTRPLPRLKETVPMRKRTDREIRRLIRSKPQPLKPSVPSSAHHIHQYLHLAAQLGASPAPLAPQLFVSPERAAAALRRLQIAPPSVRPWFGLNPGAEYGPAKRWPVDRWIAAARQIQKQLPCQWLIFGGARDVEAADQIAAGIGSDPAWPPLNLAGKTSLGELCALLQSCQVLLTNDTGPMHLAAALGTAVVVPFGSTSAALTGPGLPGDQRHRVLSAAVECAPCFRRQCPIDFRCMLRIEVEDVVEEVLSCVRAKGD